MKKALLILALPLLTATAFAQTQTAPEVKAADGVAKPVAGSTSRAEVKAEAATAEKSASGKGEVLTMPPKKSTSTLTRKEVKDETRRAGAAGELKTNGALDSIKTGESGNSTTRAEVKDEMKKENKAKKSKMKSPTEDVNVK